MQECRDKAWNWLENNPGFHRSHIKKQASDINDKLLSIEYFMADINILLKHRAIDGYLAKDLFGYTFDQWFSHFEKGKWGDDDEGKFYRDQIKPLMDRMKSIHPPRLSI